MRLLSYRYASYLASLSAGRAAAIAQMMPDCDRLGGRRLGYGAQLVEQGRGSGERRNPAPATNFKKSRPYLGRLFLMSGLPHTF